MQPATTDLRLRHRPCKRTASKPGKSCVLASRGYSHLWVDWCSPERKARLSTLQMQLHAQFTMLTSPLSQLSARIACLWLATAELYAICLWTGAQSVFDSGAGHQSSGDAQDQHSRVSVASGRWADVHSLVLGFAGPFNLRRSKLRACKYLSCVGA